MTFNYKKKIKATFLIFENVDDASKKENDYTLLVLFCEEYNMMYTKLSNLMIFIFRKCDLTFKN